MALASKSLSTDEVVNSSFVDRQAGFVEQVAGRIRQRAEARGVTYSEVVREIGASSSAVANYWTGKRPWPVEHLSSIADLLSTGVDELLGRERRNLLVDATEADWVEVPEFALLEIDEQGKMDPISTTLLRKDWLYASLGENSGLWLGRMPAPYDALGLGTGTALFCRDVRQGERLIDGTHYLFRINGGIVMGQFAYRDRDRDGGERTVLSRDIGNEEDQYQPVARVVGQLARPI